MVLCCLTPYRNSSSPGVKAVVEAYHAIEKNDQQVLADKLKEVKLFIEHIREVLKMMHTRCHPKQFYGEMQRGTNEKDYHRNGLSYEGVEPQPETYCGASVAQSSTIPVFDIFLGVNHAGKHLDFLDKQCKYMPPNNSLASYLSVLNTSILRSDNNYVS